MGNFKTTNKVVLAVSMIPGRLLETSILMRQSSLTNNFAFQEQYMVWGMASVSAHDYPMSGVLEVEPRTSPGFVFELSECEAALLQEKSGETGRGTRVIFIYFLYACVCVCVCISSPWISLWPIGQIGSERSSRRLCCVPIR